MTVVIVVLCTTALSGLVVLATTAGPAAAWHVHPEAAARRVPWMRRAARRVVHGKGGRRSAGMAALVGAGIVVLAVAIAVGSLFEMITSGSGFARFDRSVAEWGGTHATGVSLDVARVVTQLGSRLVTVLVLVAVAAYDLAKRRHIDAVLLVLAVGVGEPLITNGVKYLVRRDRPDVPHLVNAFGYSFPSGHSAAAAAAWSTAALMLGANHPRTRRVLLSAGAAAIATAVAATRALLGVHWLTDVLGGLAIGWGWYLVVAILFGGRRERLGAPIEQVARPVGASPP